MSKNISAPYSNDFIVAHAKNEYIVFQLVYDDLQPGRTFNAHIQEMSPDKGPVTVFIEELGEK